jgi:hypothetical protein
VEARRELAELAQLGCDLPLDLGRQHAAQEVAQHRIVVELVPEPGRILEERHGGETLTRKCYCPANVRHGDTSMLRNWKTGLFLIGTALVAACGSARVVQRSQYGGIVALEGDRGKAMEDAHRHMAGHCGAGNYTITLEGDEVIGTDTTYGESTDYASNESGTRAASDTSGGSSTRQATEWRVHYQCGGAPAAAPPPPGPGGY